MSSVEPGTHPGTSFVEDSGVVEGRRSYVLPAERVLFISVAKNACSSIKWMLARLSGQDPEQFAGPSQMVGEVRGAIHRRSLWNGVPMLRELTPDERRDIHPDNGWFVFGVVRDPRSRLFSAWQSKLLVRKPAYMHYQQEPFFPRLPTKTSDIVEDFATFVRFLDAHPEHELAAKNVHFHSQTELLQPDLVPYSRIYDVSQLPGMLTDLTVHLRGLGRDDEPFLTRENGSQLRPHRLMFADGVRELIDMRFAADLERFGEHWDFDRLPDGEPDWTPALFEYIADTARAYAQIAWLSDEQRRLQERVDRLSKRNARLQERISQLTDQKPRREQQRTRR
jgi:hypothetical protein